MINNYDLPFLKKWLSSSLRGLRGYIYIITDPGWVLPSNSFWNDFGVPSYDWTSNIIETANCKYSCSWKHSLYPAGWLIPWGWTLQFFVTKKVVRSKRISGFNHDYPLFIQYSMYIYIIMYYNMYYNYIYILLLGFSSLLIMIFSQISWESACWTCPSKE